MAGQVDEEEKKLRRLFEENSELHSKRLFLFLSLVVLGSIFAIYLTGLSQESNFIMKEIDIEFTKSQTSFK